MGANNVRSKFQTAANYSVGPALISVCVGTATGRTVQIAYSGAEFAVEGN
jgi:hypothetical protein